MKKILFAAAAAALTMNAALWGQRITVTSPTAGANWCIGASCTVTWTKSGTMPDTVKIRLRRAGAPESEDSVWSISDDTSNDGSFGPVTVPASVPAGDYFVRVRTNSPDVIGDSDTFHISTCAMTTISVYSPNTTSDWPLGSDQAIIWHKTGEQPHMVNITLRRVGAPESDPPAARIADGCANNGRRVWRVPDSLTPGQYIVRVRASNALMDDSAPFAISAAGASSGTAITVTQPLIGDRWCIGQERAITWTKSGPMHGYVSIVLRGIGTYNSQPDALTITTNTANDGDFRFWRIPASLAPGEYFIRIRTNERGSEHVTGESCSLTICSAGGTGTAPPGVHADLELAGAGVEYANGNIVAWVRNNGPENVFQDVKFMLNFPDQRGGGHYITRRINVPAGQERSVDIQPLSAWDIPQNGLRTILEIETSRSGIRDTHLMNQHRDVRLGCPDIRVTVPHSGFRLSRLYGMGGKDYKVEARIQVRHDGPRPLNDVQVFWRIDSSNGGVEYAQGSFVIDNLAPPPHSVEREISRTFGNAERSNADLPALSPGRTYRFWARIEDPDHQFNDPDPGNDRDQVTFTVPD